MANIEVITQINDLLDANDVTIAKTALGVLGAAVKGTGDIVNADINASAAIADTKLATIATAGKVSNSATTATNANTASTIVARDASGNFTAGTITASLTGTATAVADGAVTTAKLADYTTAGTGVTTAKLADGAVTAVKVTDAALTIAKTSGLRSEVDSTLRDSKKVRTRVCSTRSYAVNAGFTNLMAGGGTAQTETSYFAMYTTDDVSDLQVGFTNPTNGVDTKIKVAIDVGGIIYKLHFNGNRFATVSAGGVLFTDPLGFFIAKGTLVKVRTFADAGTGATLKANRTTFDNGNGGSTASVDYADSGSIGDGTANIFGPSLLIGKCSNPAVLVLGDSIADGSSGFEGEGGWPVRAFGTSIARNSGNNANILLLGIGAGKMLQLKDADRYWRGQLYKYCDIAICNFGVNDVAQSGPESFAVITARYLSLWKDLSSRGLKVWQGTITPYSTSTDAFATEANQTPLYQSNYAALNNYIRTTPSPLTGYIEVADTVMTARDSGIWKAPNWVTNENGTGIHPLAFSTNPQAHNALAAAVPVDILTRETPVTALLTSIVLTTGALSPAFATGTLSYAVASFTTSSITLRTVFDGGYNTVKVNGVEIASGALTPAISLPTIGANIITIAVTARNGTSTSTYTITVNRTS